MTPMEMDCVSVTQQLIMIMELDVRKVNHMSLFSSPMISLPSKMIGDVFA